MKEIFLTEKLFQCLMWNQYGNFTSSKKVFDGQCAGQNTQIIDVMCDIYNMYIPMYSCTIYLTALSWNMAILIINIGKSFQADL